MKTEALAELTDLSTNLENAVDNLFLIWLEFEEDRVEHRILSNAMRATYTHLNDLAKAITNIVAKESVNDGSTY